MVKEEGVDIMKKENLAEALKELLEEKNYLKIKNLLSNENEYDIASVIEDLPSDELIKVFRL